MTAAPSKLDAFKFRKVHCLIAEGATAGERAAAETRARAMAAKAGMTLEVAVSSLDAKPQTTSTDFFAGFDDWMEKKEPGFKAQKFREKAERDERDAVRRAEVLEAYGSKEKLFARTEAEAMLLDAIAPFVTKWDSWTDIATGTVHRFALEIGGRNTEHVFWKAEDLPADARQAIVQIYPWPASLRGVLDEAKMWDRLRLDRGLFAGGEWSHYAEVECRIDLLERALESDQPVASWDDVEARFDWKRWEFERQWLDPQEMDDPFLARMQADFAILRDLPRFGERGQSQTVQNGHRTTAQKRADVLSMLDTHPELSDREIARRVGVSPQTVNTWRKKR